MVTYRDKRFKTFAIVFLSYTLRSRYKQVQDASFTEFHQEQQETSRSLHKEAWCIDLLFIARVNGPCVHANFM